MLQNKPFEGKRLLILGGGANEISLVTRAQELGCSVIVADSNLDWSLSPAKYFADDVWDISWADQDLLEEKCREYGVDGVTAGYSENRIENVVKLCQRLSLPCYCTPEQLDITRDKQKFKNHCRRNSVPVVKEYTSVSDVDEYPVIVKPVDRAGSIGVGIAYDEEELIAAYRVACEASLSGRVIIEKYMAGASKVDAYYLVIDGTAVLAATSDAVFAQENGGQKVVQTAWMYPSRYEREYCAKVDESVKRLISDLGIANGYMFFSGFVDAHGEFALFEMGFRLCGGHTYEYLVRKGLPSNLDVFIYHAIEGGCAALPLGPIDNNQKYVALNYYAKEGTVASLKGFDSVKEIPSCVVSVEHGREGQVCKASAATLSKMGLVGLCSTSAKELAAAADQAHELISVRDEAGQSLIYSLIEPESIKDWWNIS